MPAKMIEQPVAGEWVWMTHPSRNGGEPFPVRLVEDDGEVWYQPFDFNSTDFPWSERDSEWRLATPPAPTPADQGVCNERAMLEEIGRLYVENQRLLATDSPSWSEPQALATPADAAPAEPNPPTLTSFDKAALRAVQKFGAPEPKQTEQEEREAFALRSSGESAASVAEPTPAMCRAAVEYLNGADVYNTVPAEVLRIEESIYSEVWKAMQAVSPTRRASPVADADERAAFEKWQAMTPDSLWSGFSPSPAAAAWAAWQASAQSAPTAQTRKQRIEQLQNEVEEHLAEDNQSDEKLKALGWVKHKCRVCGESWGAPTAQPQKEHHDHKV